MLHNILTIMQKFFKFVHILSVGRMQMKAQKVSQLIYPSLDKKM